MTGSSAALTLHRTPWMRLVGGPVLQPVALVFVVLGLLFGVAGLSSAFFAVAAVALAAWLLGATAWVRADGSGVHRRCYLPHTDAWTDIEGIELYTVSYGINAANRMIRVRRGNRRHWLAPATGNGRYTEQFGRDLVGAARAHGVAVDTSGWGGFDE